MKQNTNSIGCKLVGLIVLGVFVLYASCTQTQRSNYPNRLFVNIPPDGIVLHTPWPNKIENLTEPEIEKSLHLFIDRYTGKNVSTILFNLNYQRVCYNSEVWDSYWDVPQPNTIEGWQLHFWELQEKGVDVFDVVTEYTRQNGISPWISIRMNDHHYFNDPGKVNSFLLANKEARPGNFFNYEKPEIRHHFLKLIEEALIKYNVDGIELDLLRTPGYYGSVAVMNIFIEDVKKQVSEISLQTKRDIQIAVRVPSLPDGGLGFGLDPVFWAKNGWVDAIIPMNFDSYDNDIPVEIWKKEIGTQADCKIIPGTSYFEYLTEWGKGHRLKQTAEGLRGVTVNAYQRGADAVYVYNFFNPSDFRQKIIEADGSVKFINEFETMLTEGGNFEASINKPRRHILSYHQPGISSDVDWYLPVTIRPDSVKSYKIYTGVIQQNQDYFVRLALNNDIGFETAKLTVLVNRKETVSVEDMPRDPEYSYQPTPTKTVKNPSELGARVMQFKAKEGTLLEGYNKITISNNDSINLTIKWIEVYIDVYDAKR